MAQLLILPLLLGRSAITKIVLFSRSSHTHRASVIVATNWMLCSRLLSTVKGGRVRLKLRLYRDSRIRRDLLRLFITMNRLNVLFICRCHVYFP